MKSKLKLDVNVWDNTISERPYDGTHREFLGHYWAFILPFKGWKCYEFQFGPVVVQWGGKLGRRISVWRHTI